MNQDAKAEVKDPKVSVVIPAYNYGRFLGEAIQSVLDQTFQDWELIVVDDGSTDETAQVVASFQDPRIRYIYQENQGNAGARNRGVELAKGKYIAFLDADDLWLPEKLEKQVVQLDSLPLTVGLIYTDFYVFNHENGAIVGHRSERRHPIRGSVFSQLLRIRGWYISPTTVLIRREVFQRVGLFDESLKASVDWEMWVRIAAAYEIEALNEPLAKHREHATSIQADSERSYYYRKLARLKVLETYPLQPEDRRNVCHSLAGVYYGYGLIQLNKGKRKEGLQALLTSLRLQPTAFWRYPDAALMLLSPRLYEWLRARKQRLLKHRVRTHSAGGGASSNSLRGRARRS